MTHADFRVVAVEDDRVFLVDEDAGNKSVTNDAEWVCDWIWQKWPGVRVVYRDTMGRWDEIVMGDGTVSFRPYEEHFPF